MKRSILLIVTLLQIVLVSAQSYSLSELLEITGERSIFRQQAEATRQIARHSEAFTQTLFKPSLALNIKAPNYIKSSREIIQPDGSIRFQSVSQNNASIGLRLNQQITATGGTVFVQSDLQRFDDFSNDISSYNGIPLRVGFFQPIKGINPLKWTKRIAPLLLSEAERQYVIDREQIHVNTCALFFDLLMAQEQRTIVRSNLQSTERLIDIANERNNVGKISKSDLLQLQLELKTMQRQLAQTDFSIHQKSVEISTLMSNNASDTISVSLPDLPDTDLIIDASKALNAARQNRPELVKYQRQQLEAQRDVQQAKADYGVGVDIFASYGLARGSNKISEVYTDPISEQQLQVGISVPLLDWGKKKNAVAIARTNEKLMAQTIQQEQLRMDNEILAAIATFHQWQEDIDTQQEISDLAQQRYQIANDRYLLGNISITDLTIAQREKDQAQLNYIQSLRAYWTSYYQLRALTAHDFITDQPIFYN